jgi:hypothetical protein
VNTKISVPSFFKKKTGENALPTKDVTPIHKGPSRPRNDDLNNFNDYQSQAQKYQPKAPIVQKQQPQVPVYDFNAPPSQQMPEQLLPELPISYKGKQNDLNRDVAENKKTAKARVDNPPPRIEAQPRPRSSKNSVESPTPLDEQRKTIKDLKRERKAKLTSKYTGMGLDTITEEENSGTVSKQKSKVVTNTKVPVAPPKKNERTKSPIDHNLTYPFNQKDYAKVPFKDKHDQQWRYVPDYMADKNFGKQDSYSITDPRFFTRPETDKGKIKPIEIPDESDSKKINLG